MNLRHHKLVAWQRADDLFIALHQLATKQFPDIERFELSTFLNRRSPKSGTAFMWRNHWVTSRSSISRNSTGTWTGLEHHWQVWFDRRDPCPTKSILSQKITTARR